MVHFDLMAFGALGDHQLVFGDSLGKGLSLYKEHGIQQ